MDIEDITCPRVDMNFIFQWSTRYLTSERRERVRYQVEHEKIKFIFISKYVTFCLLYKHQWNTKSELAFKGAIYYVTITTVISSRVKITLSSRVKIWSFRGKAHLVFHWCLYNKVSYPMDSAVHPLNNWGQEGLWVLLWLRSTQSFSWMGIQTIHQKVTGLIPC